MQSGADHDDIPCPLDGDNNGSNVVDMGCYEYVSSDADSDGDIMTDKWELDSNLDPQDASDASGMSDSDSFSNLEEFVADTDPHDGNNYLCVTAVSNQSTTIYFHSSSNRVYALLGKKSLITTSKWVMVSSATNYTGIGKLDYLQDTNIPNQGPFYKIEVSLP